MNWLDLVILVCIGFGLIKGLIDGFVKQMISLLALVAAIFCAGKIAIPFRQFLSSVFTSNTFQPILTGICYLLAFSLIVSGIVLLGRLIDLAVKKTVAKPLNILLGGMFGVFVWVLSLSILFNVLAVFNYNSHIISKQTQKNSIFYERTKEVVPRLYPFLKYYFTSPPPPSRGPLLISNRRSNAESYSQSIS
ncbi:MAG: CvpA family protein [Candidatus Azobacteroides sp.]|nr:CvpA family protein [Candidatus Azobacteroides sp.]